MCVHMRVEHTRNTEQRCRHLSAHRHAYTKVQTHACTRRPSHMQVHVRNPHRHAFPCTYAHSRARTRTIHAFLSTSVQQGHIWVRTHTESHEHSQYMQGCIQTRPHRRARTRVCTPRARARARSFPQGTRLPSPSAAEAGVRRMRVGQVRGARALFLPRPATTSSSFYLTPTNLVP